MRLATWLLILDLVNAYPANCQALDRDHSSSQRTIVSPTNAWQDEVREPKTVPTSQKELAIRAFRDAYMDKVFGLGLPIEQIQEKHLSYRFPNSYLSLGRSDLPPAFPAESVVVGTFDAFDPVLSKSHQTIYDEIHISVSQVLYPQESPLAGSVIDTLIPGGTVSLNTQTLSYHTVAQEFGVMPGRRYVLFLRHIQNGDFYLLSDSISLDNGTANPNSPAAAQAAAAGKWAYAGLPESTLLTQLTTELSKQHQQ